MKDFVFPQGNEKAMIEMATRLCLTELYLCYPLQDRHIKDRKEECGKLSTDDLRVHFAVYVENQQQVQRAKHLTRDIVCKGQAGVYEDKRVRYVIDFESSRRKDFVHHRNSGLTQVFISKAKQTGKTLLVNINQLLDDRLPQHVILGRMLQNNRFFRKYRPDVLAVSGARTPLEMRSPKDMRNVLLL